MHGSPDEMQKVQKWHRAGWKRPGHHRDGWGVQCLALLGRGREALKAVEQATGCCILVLTEVQQMADRGSARGGRKYPSSLWGQAWML